MLETLMHSPIAWAVSWGGTIIGIVLAIVFFQKSKEKKEVTYCLRSCSLIRKKQKKFEKLSISYDGRQIDDLCVSNFTIWNSGNKTLNESDMVASKELTITAIENNKILDVEILKCSEETNKFSIRILDEHSVKILFEYVDKMEGVVVQVIHTGTNKSLIIGCKIKGGKPVKHYSNWTPLKNKAVNRGILVVSCVLMLVFFVLAFVMTFAIVNDDLQLKIFTSEMITEASSSKNSFKNISTTIISWLNFLYFGMVFVFGLKFIFKIGMPNSLKSHSDFEERGCGAEDC